MTTGRVGFGNASTLDFYLADFDGEVALIFQSLNEDGRSIMRFMERKAALRCAACETVIITRDEMTEAACLQCGETMGPGIAVCPKCGWTYQTNTNAPSSN